MHFPSSELLTRVSQAAEAARQVMNLLMTRVQDVLTAIALLIAMFKLDWRLSCAALFILGPISLDPRIHHPPHPPHRPQPISQPRAGHIRHSTRPSSAASSSKSYNLETRMRGRFDVVDRHVERLSNKMAVVSARTSPTMEFIGGIAVALIVFYGGYRNLVLGQSADSLIAFLTACCSPTSRSNASPR